jgi:hypothetical protein
MPGTAALPEICDAPPFSLLPATPVTMLGCHNFLD